MQQRQVRERLPLMQLSNVLGMGILTVQVIVLLYCCVDFDSYIYCSIAIVSRLNKGFKVEVWSELSNMISGSLNMSFRRCGRSHYLILTST
jgi:hypothetical protein